MADEAATQWDPAYGARILQVQGGYSAKCELCVWTGPFRVGLNDSSIPAAYRRAEGDADYHEESAEHKRNVRRKLGNRFVFAERGSGAAKDV